MKLDTYFVILKFRKPVNINLCELFTPFYIFKALGHICFCSHPLCPLICSSMPCLRDWRPSPHGQPMLASRCAACHVVATATVAVAPCQTFMFTSPLRVHTRERTQSWCFRLQGNSSHRNAWPRIWHLTRTVFSTQHKHTPEMPLLFIATVFSAQTGRGILTFYFAFDVCWNT